MSTRLSLPGPREIDATLDETGETDSVVVACPPHPQLRGDRHDSRLEAVSDALTEQHCDCLRFDYGPWDHGHAEQSDVHQAMRWARDRYDHVGLFGFSFGGAMALLAAGSDRSGVSSLVSTASSTPTPDVLSALAPAAQVQDEGAVVAALDSINCPVQIVYGERDDTADWEPIVNRARELDYTVESFPADHFFVGQQHDVADIISTFLLAQIT